MSLLNKVKNFFYEEEDEQEYEEEVKEEIKHKEKRKPKVEKMDNEVSERELFKAERTFNFPMDIEDDDSEFNGIKIEEPVKTNVIKEPIYKQKQTEEKPKPYVGIRNYAKVEEKKEEREVKKFKPTPVISPIYGIMDKNYKKEDVIIDAASDYNTKKVDYDEVRRKAYGSIYNTEVEEKKDIFYNLDEEKEVEDEDDDDVKIIYNDVTLDEEDENITIGEKQEKYEKELEYDDEDISDDDNILSETKEQDLFNLIDNMYNSDDDYDEEEE